VEQFQAPREYVALGLIFGRTSADGPVDDIYGKAQKFLSAFENQSTLN
jgi:hypothetical protein